MINKKALSEVAIGIIAMIVLLVAGSLFLDNNDTGSRGVITYPNSDGSRNPSYNYGSSSNSDFEYDEDYIFYLNDTQIGKQRKVTENYPNIELGSSLESKIVYIGTDHKLRSTPFSKTHYTFEIELENPQEVKGFLFYFDPTRLSGEEKLMITINGETLATSFASDKEVPIKVIKRFHENQTKAIITLELLKPNWYELFNWNSLQIEDFKVMMQTQNIANNEKEFNFQLDKRFLERVEANFVINCEDPDVNPPVKVTVNDFIIADYNPDCATYTSRVIKQIPLNILTNEKNTIKFETQGHYKLAYSLNKIYYNDQESYKFRINSFDDIVDIVMYGEFDRSVIDLKVNSQLVDLKDSEIKSILPFLKFGTNEIEFKSKPLNIEKFVIEKNSYYYD